MAARKRREPATEPNGEGDTLTQAGGRSADRHKARSSIAVYPPLYLQLAQLARTAYRPIRWELHLAIAKYLREAGIEPDMPKVDADLE